MTKAANPRRSQADRRAQSREAVLNSAIKLFGELGYECTSLEAIAAECGLTIRPVYHYFGNKKALFAAVNDVMEQRIVAGMRVDEAGIGLVENWRAYLDLCDDPAFRRIVLVDSPTILGRERWETSIVTEKARAALATKVKAGKATRDKKVACFRRELNNSVFMAVLTEAALKVAEADDTAMAKREAEQLMLTIFAALQAD